MSQKRAKKGIRVRLRPQHKWTNEQQVSLLKSIVFKISGDPQKFEKPTVIEFYESLFQDYFLYDLEKLGAWLCKNKMRNLRDKYRKAVTLLKEKKNLEARKYISRCCPHYKMLEKIFGQKVEGHNSSKITPKPEYTSYESENEEDQSIPSPEPAKRNYYDKSNRNKQTNTYEHFKRPSNPFIQYMTETQEKRNELEEKKMQRQIKYEERLTQFQREKLELKNEKFYFDRKMEEKRVELMKETIEAEIEIKKQQLEKDYELKQYELELKYKYNNK